MRLLFAAAALAALPVPALARPATAPVSPAPVTLADVAALEHSGYVWDDTGVGRLSVVVSLPDQRAYVYRGTVLVAASAVSTGRQGRDTPVGSFPVLEKATMHRSSKYDDAPMPFMQRLTWDGVALHVGSTPGYPDSHGCVHLPAGFAKKLFAATRIGTSVTVVDASIDGAPADLTPPPPVDPEATRQETASANQQQLAALDR